MTGKRPIELKNLLTLEQQLLIKLLIRQKKIDAKLTAQAASLTKLKTDLKTLNDHAASRLYHNCIGIQSQVVGSLGDSSSWVHRCRLGFYTSLPGYDPFKKAG